MENNFSSFLPSQLPEYLQEQAPLFSGFIKAYYQYASQRNASIGTIQYNSLEHDIDDCSEVYIDEFYSTYGKDMPKSITMDRRNFVKLLNSIYCAKGTEKALEIIFRALFGETIAITYPSSQILRASDGVWVHEKYITLKTIFGGLPAGDLQLTFSNSVGEFFINSFATDLIDFNTHRIFFKSFSQISIDVGQLIYIYNTTGDIVYIGELKASPSYLRVLAPGKFWKTGQVIIIPGSVKNTIARVKSVSSTGQILSTEILEYGYTHTNEQISVSSPFPVKPISSTIDIVSTVTSINPVVYNHVVNITDITDGTSENIVGVGYGTMFAEAYFLEDYISTNDYTGDIVIAKSFTQPTIQPDNVNTNLSIGDWLASRATFSFEYENVVQSRGYYGSDSGQISNQQIKLQDNYFYQAFSYLIETSKDVRDYSTIFPITHPAGTKRFSSLVKAATFDTNFSSSRIFSVDTNYISDFAYVTEYPTFGVSTVIFDTNTVSDSYTVILNKILSELVLPTDVSSIAFSMGGLADTVSQSEVTSLSVTTVLLDSTVSTDYSSIDFTKSGLVDGVVSTDSASIDSTRYLSDSSTTTDIPSISFSAGGLADITTSTDVTSISATTVLLDSSVTSDITNINFSRSSFADTGVTSDLLSAIDTIKYLNDTATASHIESATVSTNTYDAESYFGESYTETIYNISIG